MAKKNLSSMFEDFDNEEKEIQPIKPAKTESSPKPKKQSSDSKKKEQIAQEIIYKSETIFEMLLTTWSRFKDINSSHGNEMRKVIEKIEEYKKL
jgi:hypothetical protein